MNLKKVLMDLGNTLVLDRGFLPSGPVPAEVRAALLEDTTTEPIVLFTEWVNLHPEARQSLEGMGISWPMPRREAP